MNIAIIGTGYVGLPSGVGLAELGHKVTCIDVDRNKIDALNRGELTLYEDGLEPLFKKNLKNGNLKFTTSTQDGIENADVVILAVGTPPDPVTKAADLTYIFKAAAEVGKYLCKYTVICDKSTVPVGTGDKIEQLISESNPKAEFDVVSLPEFLREGFAVHDFFNPDRIVLGTQSERARKILLQMYAPLQSRTRIICVNRKSAETIKYASNSFLAMKIHYINEIADFCEKSGADINDVALGVGLDSRIGDKFLNPGPGFGGSCFPKDTLAMDYMAREVGVNLTLIQSAISGNIVRKKIMARKILHKASRFENPKIAVLGIAFKGGTDDCRESPAVDIIKEMLNLGARNITVYDPKALDNAKSIFGTSLSYASSVTECIKDADLLITLTEWNDFRKLDLTEIAKLMKHRVIEDYRNLFRPETAIQAGFEYSSIGRSYNNSKEAIAS